MSGIEIHGPFATPRWRLSIDGFEVPHCEVGFRGGDEDGPNWTLIVDRRFATDWVTREEIERWAFVLANMGAVCAGLSCHGEHSQPLNRFACRISGIGSDEMASMRRASIVLVPEDER